MADDQKGAGKIISDLLGKLKTLKGKIDIKKVFTGGLSRKQYIFIGIGALVVVVILFKTAGHIRTIIEGKKEAAKKAVTFEEAMPVKAYKVKKMDFKDTLPVMGRIEGSKEIDLKFETSGILESFNFEEGERILEGDIVASLSQKDALLKLKYASLELEKAKKIFDLGGSDKVAYEQKSLEYESAKRDLEKTNIYAVSDGYLASREKMPGAYVTPQDKVGSFVDYSKVYASFDVIEEDAPKIKLGQNTEIFLDAFPGQTFTGTVDMMSPIVEGRTRTQNMKVELENKDDMMKPGMFARATVNTYEKKDALIIPASAFKKKEQQYFVYVIHEEGEEKPAEGEGAAASADTEEGTTAQSEKTGINSGDDAKGGKDLKGMGKALGIGGKGEGKAGAEGAAGTEAQPAEEETKKGTIEEREIEIAYLTHDVAEIGKGLEEGELIVRELHQEYKDKDKVEITEVQDTLI